MLTNLIAILSLGQSTTLVQSPDALKAVAAEVATWFDREVQPGAFGILRYPGDKAPYLIGAGLTIQLNPDGTLISATDDQRRERRTKPTSKRGVNLSEAAIKNTGLQYAKLAFPKSTFVAYDWKVNPDDYNSTVGVRSWDSGCAQVRFVMDERRGSAYVLVVQFETDSRNLTQVLRAGPIDMAVWNRQKREYEASMKKAKSGGRGG